MTTRRRPAIADNLKDLAFEQVTLSGISIGMSDLFEVKGPDPILTNGITRAVELQAQARLGFITDQERYRLTVASWRDINKQLLELIVEQFPLQNTSFSLIVASEARGKLDMNRIKQIMLSNGVISDATGKPLDFSVNNSYSQGLSTLEYFVAARGGRKSLIDVALSTADAGHLTRRLVYVAQDVFTVKDDPDLVDPGFVVSRSDSDDVGFSFGQRLANRYSAEDVVVKKQTLVKQGELITKKIAAAIEAAEVEAVRIMSCLSATNLDGIPTKKLRD